MLLKCLGCPTFRDRCMFPFRAILHESVLSICTSERRLHTFTFEETGVFTEKAAHSSASLPVLAGMVLP